MEFGKNHRIIMTIYDAHCHVFNGSILQDTIHLMAMPEERAVPDELSLWGWWKWLHEIANVLVESEEENNQFIVDVLQSNMANADGYATIPLMMDISHMFGSVLHAGQQVEQEYLEFRRGLQNQIEALQALSLKGNCYPFFAVDPRRSGLIEAILDGAYITRKAGGFYGVKLRDNTKDSDSGGGGRKDH